jgi:CubicO group peptidase (beta-lactamase class C family)
MSSGRWRGFRARWGFLPAPDALLAELSALVAAAQVEERLPSVSAALFQGGDVLWADAFGLADIERGEEATPEHQYRVGSITKTFTAAAMLQLRDAGKLDLDDPLERHLPEAVHGAPTLRQMLSHVSGLQREVPGEVWESLEFPSSDALLEAFAASEQVLARGSHWHYSNLAYSLLGEVVAQRAGMPYERWVEERLLRPVGLERTTWEPVAPYARGYFVEPYEDVARPEVLPDLLATRAAGQLWSTTADLARWGSFLAAPDPDVLRPQTAEEMRSFHGLSDPVGWKLGYGLGLELFRDGDRILFGHSGGMPGFVTRFAHSVADDLGAAVLTASSTGRRAATLCLELVAKAAEVVPPRREPWRPGEAAPPDVAGILGSWWLEGQELVFRYAGGRLEARQAQAPAELEPSVLAPDGDDRFRVISGPERGELLRVVRDGGDDPVKLYLATYPLTRKAQIFGR